VGKGHIPLPKNPTLSRPQGLGGFGPKFGPCPGVPPDFEPDLSHCPTATADSANIPETENRIHHGP